MKKGLKLIVVVGLLALTGCSKPKETEKISLLTPQGATALSALSVYNNEFADVTSVAGSDVITAELAKKDASYDVIIAPLNIGAKMMEKDNTEYRLDSIITWGNLYLVGTNDYVAGDEVAAFGENAVPGLVFQYVQPEENATYFNSAQDVQTQLLSGKMKAGLLAEPAVSATIAKAKKTGVNFSVINNIQAAYAKKSGIESQGFPQAAIFVKQGCEEKVEAALSKIDEFTNATKATNEELAPLIEHAGIDNLGIPSAEIAILSWERQNISYVKAKDVQEEISTFLQLFDISFNESMLIK